MGLNGYGDCWQQSWQVIGQIYMRQRIYWPAHAIHKTATTIVLVSDLFRYSVSGYATDDCTKIALEHKLRIAESIKMSFWATYMCYWRIVEIESLIFVSLRYKNSSSYISKVLFGKRELFTAFSYFRSKRRKLTRRTNARKRIFFSRVPARRHKFPLINRHRQKFPRASSCWTLGAK